MAHVPWHSSSSRPNPLGCPNVTSSTRLRRTLVWGAAAAIVTGLVYLMATASTGPVDPAGVAAPPGRATIVFNGGMFVFREGLEAVLIFAAVTASFRGANARRRRPVVAGGAGGAGAARGR